MASTCRKKRPGMEKITKKWMSKIAVTGVYVFGN